MILSMIWYPFLRLARLLGFTFLLVSANYAYAQQSAKGAEAALKGSSSIVTNYIEKGISQSENQASLNASATYHLNQGRVGVWAASVGYPDTEERIRLKMQFGFSFDWTQNFKTNFDYAFVRHIGATGRDANVSQIKIMTFGYDFYYENEDNFEGNGDERSWYGAGKAWQIPWDLLLNTKLGYSIIDSTDYNSHFDADISVTYAKANFAADIGATYNSAASEIGDRAAPHLYLVLKINY